MVEVKWMNSALRDLESIVSYISRDSSHYAEIFKKKIFDLVSSLEKFPKIGRKVPEYRDENTRELIFKNYRIIYRIDDDTVEILTVHHGKRLL